MKTSNDQTVQLGIDRPRSDATEFAFLKRVSRSDFWVRLRHWEYWPFHVVYFPIVFYWIWLAMKARSFFFFSAANPGIEFGGMLGESKHTILQKLPQDLTPMTFFFKPDQTADQVLEKVSQSGLAFPLVGKPDVGERGWLIQKLDSPQDLKAYVNRMHVNFLIQEYVDLPIELGVLYYRYPGERSGHISSITGKKFLSITGDGHSTLAELIMAYPRARLQAKALFRQYHAELQSILPEGHKKRLVSIGNHRLGTTFLNSNYLITPELVQVFDRVSLGFDGFYFGRYDIRCNSIDDLNQGNFKILELNGAGAEPTHIYQPGSSIWAAYRVILFHLGVLFEISRANHQSGQPYMSFRQGMSFLQTVKAYRRHQVNHQ